jgi:hypothetical protein
MATLPQKQKSAQEIFPQSRDLSYIIKHIPIEEVWANLAEENPGLGLEPIRNHATRCPWHHDQVPSFNFGKNNKSKCHVCDVGLPYYSNLDLVKKVLQCDVPKALRWFEAHWDIPFARAGRPPGSHGAPKPYRTGLFGGALESIVRSGLFGELSGPAARLLPVLVAVQDERGQCDWSYLSLMDATGIRSPNAVRKGLTELIHLHAITERRVARLDGPGHRNLYRVTLDDPRLLTRIELAHGAHKYANDLARINRKLRSHSKRTRTQEQGKAETCTQY